MIIENNKNITNIPISRIKIGESFMYNNCLHIKIDRGYIETKYNFSNAVVDLENNRLNVLGDNIAVIPINAKIVIE